MPEPSDRSGTNPYRPPTVTSTHQPPAGRKIYTVLAATVIGLIGGGVAEYLIYADDPRTGTSGPSLRFVVVAGSLVCGAIWFLAGTIVGTRVRTLTIPLITSLLAVVLWIAFGGTYADVLGAATCFAWPLGGLLGAVLWRALLRRRIATLANQNSMEVPQPHHDSIPPIS